MLIYLGTGTRRYHAAPISERPRRLWEFQAVVAGSIEPVIDGAGTGNRSRCLWVFPPEQAHGWSSPPETEAEVVVFHFRPVPDAFLAWFDERRMHAVALDDADVAALRAMADTAAAHVRRPTELSALHFDEILHRLCVLALKDVREPPLVEETALARHRVETAQAWYLANLHRQPDLAEVAAAAHLSPAHLRRTFRTALGRTPRDVMRELQLDRAEELLRETDWPLRRVATASGYRHLEVFCRSFARHRGMPPGKWRELRRGPRHQDKR
jgi:AraC family transcriptional regulator